MAEAGNRTTGPPSRTPQPALARARGENAYAELETLVILGGGSFEVGVRHVTRLLNRVSLPSALASYKEPFFAEWVDRRSWSASLYASDLALLRGFGTSIGVSLSMALTVAMPHVAPGYEEPLQRRLKEILDEEDWRARGVLRRWTPPRPRGRQVHFPHEEESPSLDAGIRR